MVLGIVGLLGAFFCGIGVVAAVIGLVLGYVAKREIRDSAGRQTGSGMATAGIVLGWIGVGLAILLIGFVILAAVSSGPSTPIQ